MTASCKEKLTEIHTFKKSVPDLSQSIKNKEQTVSADTLVRKSHTHIHDFYLQQAKSASSFLYRL